MYSYTNLNQYMLNKSTISLNFTVVCIIVFLSMLNKSTISLNFTVVCIIVSRGHEREI